MTEPTTQSRWRVVGTGDSVLALVLGIASPGGAITTSDRWINCEHGRNAYTPGMLGQASTASIWPMLLSRSQLGGWIIVQDNAIGVSDSAWESLMRRMVDETPDDRCLLGIPPAYRADVNPDLHDDAVRRAEIMVNTFATQPCHVTLPWPGAVEQHPEWVPDGQHPNPSGQTWLRNGIAQWVGP